MISQIDSIDSDSVKGDILESIFVIVSCQTQDGCEKLSLSFEDLQRDSSALLLFFLENYWIKV